MKSAMLLEYLTKASQCANMVEDDVRRALGESISAHQYVLADSLEGLLIESNRVAQRLARLAAAVEDSAPELA